jgi:hypothetical protein
MISLKAVSHLQQKLRRIHASDLNLCAVKLKFVSVKKKSARSKLNNFPIKSSGSVED